MLIRSLRECPRLHVVWAGGNFWLVMVCVWSFSFDVLMLLLTPPLHWRCDGDGGLLTAASIRAAAWGLGGSLTAYCRLPRRISLALLTYNYSCGVVKTFSGTSSRIRSKATEHHKRYHLWDLCSNLSYLASRSLQPARAAQNADIFPRLCLPLTLSIQCVSDLSARFLKDLQVRFVEIDFKLTRPTSRSFFLSSKRHITCQLVKLLG